MKPVLSSHPVGVTGALTRDRAAEGFAALGAAPRLVVLRCLVRAGEGGMTVAALREATGLAPSTLAHHLRALAEAGIIVQERVGRETRNRAAFDTLRVLAQFILAECCADAPDKEAVHGRHAAARR